MSAANHAATIRFLRAVRRRLWTQGVVDVALAGAWAAAVILVANGLLTHLAARAYPPMGSVIVAATTFLLATGYGLVFRQPSIEQAARRADSWFASKDLLVSAWDQFQRAPADRAPAAEVVLSDADAMADVWCADLRRRSPSLGVRRYYAPCVIATAGLFLNWTLGGGATPSVSPRATASAAREHADSKTSGAARGMLTWRGSTPPDPATSAHSSEAAATERLQGAPAATGRDAPSNSDSKRLASAPTSADLDAHGATQAGSAQPMNGAPPAAEGGDDVPVTFVDIARPAGDQAAGAVVDLESKFAGHAGAASGESTPPAKTVDVPRRLDHSPTQRAYIAAYLQGLGDRE